MGSGLHISVTFNENLRETMLLTTVLLITQVPAVIVSITHKAVIKALARMTVEHILTAICT